MSEQENMERSQIPDNGQRPEEIIYSEQIITPGTEPELLSVKSLDENMEVHKHPHHVTHKKKWGEYLLEFLMLFLAVFLGFLAENLREHQVEKEREKQYIESLIADLKSDQEVLSKHIVHVAAGLSMMDSMINILNAPSQIAGNTGQLYFLQDLRRD